MKMKIFALILSQIFAASDISEFVSVPAADDGFETGKHPVTDALYKIRSLFEYPAPSRLPVAGQEGWQGKPPRRFRFLL